MTKNKVLFILIYGILLGMATMIGGKGNINTILIGICIDIGILVLIGYILNSE